MDYKTQKDIEEIALGVGKTIGIIVGKLIRYGIPLGLIVAAILVIRKFW